MRKFISASLLALLVSEKATANSFQNTEALDPQEMLILKDMGELAEIDEDSDYAYLANP